MRIQDPESFWSCIRDPYLYLAGVPGLVYLLLYARLEELGTVRAGELLARQMGLAVSLVECAVTQHDVAEFAFWIHEPKQDKIISKAKKLNSSFNDPYQDSFHCSEYIFEDKGFIRN